MSTISAISKFSCYIVSFAEGTAIFEQVCCKYVIVNFDVGWIGCADWPAKSALIQNFTDDLPSWIIARSKILISLHRLEVTYSGIPNKSKYLYYH